MKDCKGKKIKVGDNVVVVASSWPARLLFGQVLEFNEHGIKVKYEKTTTWLGDHPERILVQE